VIGLLGALKENDIVNADQKKREKLIRDLASSSPEAAEGILFLRRQTVSLTYAVTQKGRKQNKPWWVTLGSHRAEPQLDGSEISWSVGHTSQNT
jgi:hypothetical protein